MDDCLAADLLARLQIRILGLVNDIHARAPERFENAGVWNRLPNEF